MPDFKKLVQQRIAPLGLTPAAERNLMDEITDHLEDLYQRSLAAGVSEQEALQTVMKEFEDMQAMKTGLAGHRLPKHDPVTVGDSRRSNYLADLWKDIRYAGRTMRQNPLFVFFVVLTLGLGIGANTTVFTVINTLILDPLPAVQNVSGLAAVSMSETIPLSYPNFSDLRQKNEVFDSLAGYVSVRPLLNETGATKQRVFGEIVTGNYFSTLGLHPALGRFFLPDEDSTPGTKPVAVMNYATWQSRFGGASDILGKTLRINGLPFTIIGVAPPRFIGVNAIFGPDLWIPAAMAERLLPNEMQSVLSDRGKAVFHGLGRLKPGVSRSQAEANITTVAAALAREYPQTNKGRLGKVRPLSDVIFGTNSGMDRTPIMFGSAVLLAVVGIVLLIACSNVANLLLARAGARRQEIALRLAMGASRSRIIRQLLTESVCLGLLSGLAGVAIGFMGSDLLWSFLPADVTANMIAPKTDGLVFLYGVLISVFTGFAFGVMPALRAARTGVAEALKEEARTTGRSRRRITVANTLLAGQVAFSFLSLVTATLFLRSIERAYQIDPGFQTQHLVVVMTNPGQAGYSQARIKTFYKEARERVSQLPGVKSASWASNLPLWGRVASGLEIEGRQARSKSDLVTTIANTVDIGYFETAGIAIDRGRTFTAMDQASSVPVAIVNEKLVHDYWPNENPLGKHVQLPGEKVLRQVIGVARTANYSTLAEPPQLCVYVPLEQSFSDSMIFYVRSDRDPRQAMAAVQDALKTVGPEVPAPDIRTGTTIVDQALFTAKLGVALLGIFGLLALGLASIGLYGIIAYSVSQRRREIGVRMALGAAQRSVLVLVLRSGMTLVLTGLLVGFVVALAMGRLLTRMLFGVSATDPISMISAAAVLMVVALMACYLPARSASRVDPIAALRSN
ncbi:MAG TPA: ABC transporter permease [Bryobacteraceae bacterium]|nr:ABC transporter permease [Bryobacteraceae bacterium]